VDNWLRHVWDVEEKHQTLLAAAGDEARQGNRLCELNVIEQVMNVCQTTVVQEAWARGQDLAVHGLIYGIHDGRLRDLNMRVAHPRDIALSYKSALLLVGSAGEIGAPDGGLS